MSAPPPSPADEYYVVPTPGDFRQGDIYRDIVHLMLSQPGYQVLRTRQAPQDRIQVFLHDENSPPKEGFNWEVKERVAADGQLGLAIVLTHDCEIENSDNKEHRLVGFVRPFDRLNPQDQQTTVVGNHYARFYLPPWPAVDIVESYVDLRRITTLRHDALPPSHRVASMTDLGRQLLQSHVVRYLTELYRR